MLEDDGSLDGAKSHNDFEVRTDGVEVVLLVSEFQAGGSRRGGGGEDNFADVCSGQDWMGKWACSCVMRVEAWT